MIKVGERLGRFELLRELGRGSHGVVFEARDTLLDERVAIKALQPWLSGDPTLRERFKRELILTRRVAHPGVCRLFDLHEEGEAFFISMQFVEGRSLSAVIREDAPGLARLIRLLRGVCGALAAAHAQGVVHRDLKPANIMVDAEDRVVVLDFGIATATGIGQLTRPGQALGSVPYIAPEVWEGGPATPLGDQYALGVIGFVAATGTLPYRGNNPLEVVDAIRAGAPTLRERWPEVDPGYERVILRAMSRDPDLRFRDVSVLDAALAELRLSSDAAALSSKPAADTNAPAPVTMEARTPHAQRRADSELLTVHTGIVEITPGVDSAQALASIPSGEVQLLPSLLSGSPIDGHAPEPTSFADQTRPDISAVRSTAPELKVPAPDAKTGAFATPAPTDPRGRVGDVTVVDHRAADLPTDTGPREERGRRPADVTVVVRDPLARVAANGLAANDLADDDLAAVKRGNGLWYAAFGLVAAALVLAVVLLTRGGDPVEVVNAVDAGTAGAGGTAGNHAAVADAGVAAVVDAAVVDAGVAEAVDELAGLELAPPTDEGKPRTVKRDALAQLLADARQKGVRAGDVPAFDQAVDHAKKAEGAARDAEAAAAKKVLDAVAIDKSFVGRKLAYFNAAFDKAPPAVQERVKPVSRDVLQKLAKNDWRGANARLNQGFDLLRKK